MTETTITTPHAEDPGREIMKALVMKTIERLKTNDWELITPAFLEFTRKLLNDNAVTFAQVKRGEFGALYQKAAEEFPFQETGPVDHPN